MNSYPPDLCKSVLFGNKFFCSLTLFIDTSMVKMGSEVPIDMAKETLNFIDVHQKMMIRADVGNNTMVTRPPLNAFAKSTHSLTHLTLCFNVMQT